MISQKEADRLLVKLSMGGGEVKELVRVEKPKTCGECRYYKPPKMRDMYGKCGFEYVRGLVRRNEMNPRCPLPGYDYAEEATNDERMEERRL